MMLPRFKLEYEVSLNDTLKALGMEIAFDSGANFSGIGPGLFISEVKHKTFVEVNEEGTEAAAVTAGLMPDSDPPDFRVDRPFFFAIYDAETRDDTIHGNCHGADVASRSFMVDFRIT